MQDLVAAARILIAIAHELGPNHQMAYDLAVVLGMIASAIGPGCEMLIAGAAAEA